MLNEEKIILMTQMASYEENEGKKNMAIGRYFRSDYIAIQVLKSVLCATIAYAVCFALFIFYPEWRPAIIQYMTDTILHMVFAKR